MLIIYHFVLTIYLTSFKSNFFYFSKSFPYICKRKDKNDY